MLSWQPGTKPTRQRLTAPIETASMASLSSDYIQAIRKFYNSASDDGSKAVQVNNKTVTCDQLIRICINNGVPLQTSTTLDQSIISHLTAMEQTAATNMTAQAHNAAIFLLLTIFILMTCTILLLTSCRGTPCKSFTSCRGLLLHFFTLIFFSIY